MSDSPANPENPETPSTPRVSEVDAQLSAWLEAAGLETMFLPTQFQTIRKIGAFLENSGRLPRELVVQILADIDHRSRSHHRSTPASAFVKSDEFDGCWLTDTGLAADTLRSNPFPPEKKMFACLGVLPAIKAVSKTVCTETPPRIPVFRHDPTCRPKQPLHLFIRRYPIPVRPPPTTAKSNP